MLRNLTILIVFLVGTATLGCVVPNYRYGRFGESSIPLGQSYQQVVQGGGLGRYDGKVGPRRTLILVRYPQLENPSFDDLKIGWAISGELLKGEAL